MSIFLLKKSLKPLEAILFSEMLIVFFMAFGLIPREFSYLVLIMLAASFIKLNLLDSLKLFILSIPFFVALPASALSDSMSVWRFLIVVLFLKTVYEKYKFYLKNCHSEFISESAEIKGLTILQFLKQIAEKIEKAGGCRKKILKQVQNGINQMSKSNYYRLVLLTALFLIIAALSLLFAQNVGVGIKKILFLTNIFLLFPIVIYSVKNESDLAEIIKFIFYSSAIVVFIGYLQFLSTFFIPLYDFWQFWAGNIIKALYGEGLSVLLAYSNTWFSYYRNSPPTLRMFSVMPDSHSFAMLVIISMPVILSLVFRYKEKYQRKKCLFAALILFFTAVFFSGSRGAWAASLFALIAALYLFYGFNKPMLNLKSIFPIKTFNFKREEINSKLIIYSVVLFFILAPVSFLILGKNQEAQIFQQGLSMSDKERSMIFERALSIYDFSETSNKGRLQIWKETAISISYNPILGVGFGNYPLILGEKLSASKKGSSAHSIYLDIAAETGILGMIVFILIAAEILRFSYNLFFTLKTEYLKILAGSFFVYFSWIFAYSIFDVVIFNDKVLIFTVILVGILYAAGGEGRGEI